MGNPSTETKNTCDKARQGKPPPNSASRATSPQGCTRRLGATTGDKEESIPSTSMDTAELATGLLPMQVGITGSHDDQGYSVSSVDGVAVWRTNGVSYFFLI